MSKLLSDIYFNSEKLNNDLEGEMKGSVLFSQATVLPSRASTLPGDIQPRMVSFRDTMILFKPLVSTNSLDGGIDLDVIDDDKKVIFSTKLAHPEQLPRPAAQLSVGESEFIEPLTYDYVISHQSEFERMRDDTEGRYLITLLEHADTIKIVTSDGHWLRNIYLPTEFTSQRSKLITLEHKASYDSDISYSGKVIKSRTSNTFFFRTHAGVWYQPVDLPFSQIVQIFVDPKAYDYVISSQRELTQIANDPDALHLKNLLSTKDTIKISTGDGRWAKYFYLPENMPTLNARKIIFESKAGYLSQVIYSGMSSSLSRGQTLVFININGVWAEWNDSQYAKISYGHNFWSGVVPHAFIYPGVSFVFKSNRLTGIYNNPDIGAPGELRINTIDIGMLTPNQQRFTFQYNDEYHRQYFQQIPASRLIVNEYEPVYWEEIMMPDGTLYRDRSNDEGSVHSGDMRQYIGKELISLGINNASYGIHSSAGKGEGGLNNRFAAAQLTAHNAVGNYINGRIVHGLSGGAGIITLSNSVGNEFSHEAGHNFGLGHFPNGFAGSIHRSADAVNSTWGWDSDKNIFIPNFEKAHTDASACLENQCQSPFYGHKFGADAMAGGSPFYITANEYTLYTPYSLHQIQKFLENKVVFCKTASTGFKKWNEKTKSMEEWAEFYSARQDELGLDPMTSLVKKYRLIEVSQYDGHYARNIYFPSANSNAGKGISIVHNATFDALVHVNGQSVTVKRGDVLKYESNGSSWVLVNDYSFNVVKKPAQQEVPVTTILGYYDPDNELPSYIYPALHCASGCTYSPDRSIEINNAKCHIEIKNINNQILKFMLRGQRVNKTNMNRFHINVPTSFAPTTVTIYCNGVKTVTKEILPARGGTRVTLHGRRSTL